MYGMTKPICAVIDRLLSTPICRSLQETGSCTRSNMGLNLLHYFEACADGIWDRFYGGNLIFRGHFNASGLETAITITVQYGFAGGYSAWLNGIFLGSSQGDATTSLTTTRWMIPTNSLRVSSDNVFVILQGTRLTAAFTSESLISHLRPHRVSSV